MYLHLCKKPAGFLSVTSFLKSLNLATRWSLFEIEIPEYLPFWIGHGAEGSRPSPEVGTLDPIRLVLEIVARQAAGVGRIRLAVHDLEGPAGIGRVAEVFVAGHATHARREDGVPGGAARRRAPRRQAPEETAAGLLDGVQLPAGDAVLLLDVLARVQRGRATIPRVQVARSAVATVEVHLR